MDRLEGEMARGAALAILISRDCISRADVLPVDGYGESLVRIFTIRVFRLGMHGLTGFRFDWRGGITPLICVPIESTIIE